MSLENNILSIAKSLESIARSLEHTEKYVENVAPVSLTPVVQNTIAPASPNVVIEEIPFPEFAPSLVAPVVLPTVASGASLVAPFTDGKGLIAYVMESYKSLGPVNGAKIQEVLTGIGYANINEVKPESYAALYAGVEALK